MATTVTIINNPATSVSLVAANRVSASVGLAPSSNLSLGNLTNVDVAGAVNNSVLSFNADNNKFVAAPVIVDANTVIAGISGGTF